MRIKKIIKLISATILLWLATYYLYILPLSTCNCSKVEYLILIVLLTFIYIFVLFVLYLLIWVLVSIIEWSFK